MREYQMKKTALAAALMAAALTLLSAQEGKKLEFKYKEGDNFGLISTVIEDVKVNGRMNHHAEIISRVTERVDKTDENGRGHILGTFMTSEQATLVNGLNLTPHKWGETFESDFLSVYCYHDFAFCSILCGTKTKHLFIRNILFWRRRGHQSL